eukprot:2819630-Lingulodinium_polyedra.AAC.1
MPTVPWARRKPSLKPRCGWLGRAPGGCARRSSARWIWPSRMGSRFRLLGCQQQVVEFRVGCGVR